MITYQHEKEGTKNGHYEVIKLSLNMMFGIMFISRLVGQADLATKSLNTTSLVCPLLAPLAIFHKYCNASHNAK